MGSITTCGPIFSVRKASNDPNRDRLLATTRNFHHHHLDVRDRAGLHELMTQQGPFDLIVHCAAEPSHDLAARRPTDDFDVNAVGTFNLLEATRELSPHAVFILMSTNKVYGDAPNELPLKELPSRWDYARISDYDGISEDMRIDRSKHSIFGASKVAADVMAQEYGLYYGLKTTILRGGCLTGRHHSGVELHGFLSYLVKAQLQGRPYRIYGYKGKQVRDNIHSHDVARLIEAIYEHPRCGAVYNLWLLLHPLDPRSLRYRRPIDGKEDGCGASGRKPRRRSHMLHYQPPPGATGLSRVGYY